jgi:hypothetical protein
MRAAIRPDDIYQGEIMTHTIVQFAIKLRFWV